MFFGGSVNHESGPTPPLLPSRGEGLFPAFVSYIKSFDSPREEENKAALEAKLKEIDWFLEVPRAVGDEGTLPSSIRGDGLKMPIQSLRSPQIRPTFPRTMATTPSSTVGPPGSTTLSSRPSCITWTSSRVTLE